MFKYIKKKKIHCLPNSRQTNRNDILFIDPDLDTYLFSFKLINSFIIWNKNVNSLCTKLKIYKSDIKKKFTFGSIESTEILF